MDYTLTIKLENENEWNVVMGILTAMEIRSVIIDEVENVIMISESPVRLARIISVITGTLYEE